MKLLKGLATLILGLITIAILLFAAVIVLTKFANNSDFAELVKSEVVKHPIFVKLINLNQPGDARHIYLNPKDNFLTVNIYYYDETNPNKDVKEWVWGMIYQTANLSPVVETIKLSESVKSEYTKQNLNALRNTLETSEKGETVNIIYLTKFSEAPTNIGITLHRDTIFIFTDAIIELTQSPVGLQRLEQSTLMHEWGHLLNLPHTQDENCIMNEKIDVYEGNFLQGREIPVEYCPETLKANKL